jgi:hypothetical protein
MLLTLVTDPEINLEIRGADDSYDEVDLTIHLGYLGDADPKKHTTVYNINIGRLRLVCEAIIAYTEAVDAQAKAERC